MRGAPRRQVIRHFGSGLLLAVAAAACSSATSGAGPTGGTVGSVPAGATTPGTGATDYCSLFTSAEVAAILGRPVGAGFGTGFVCTWTTSDASTTASVYRSLPGLYDEAASQPGYRPVSGIGDRAAIGPSAIGGTEAIAVANGAYWLVRLDPSPSDDALLGFLRQFLARGH